jgi:hypothetical protein
MKMDLVGSMLPRLLPQRAIPDTNVGNIENTKIKKKKINNKLKKI